MFFMSRRLQFLLRMCSAWQKPCSATYVMANVSNNSFTSPQSSGKRSLHLIQKSDHPCVWNITGTSSSLWMWIRRFWMVELHSLMLASWQKAISSITCYAVWLSAWSPQQNDFMASLKQQVAKRIFGVFNLARIGRLGLLAGQSYSFPSQLFCYTLS